MGNSVASKSPHYKLEEIIGRGAIGQIWRAECLKTHKFYAIKVMRKSRVLKKQGLDNLMNERKLLKSLSHPFIVNCKTAFQDKLSVYLVLDLLEGGDLRFHMLRMKFSESQSKFFIVCALIGLEYLHSQGIVHRDIKPENLLFEANGYLRITDLGIAQKANEFSPCNSGTLNYLAPEVLLSYPYGFYSDFYALGIILYEIIMGRKPYYARSVGKLISQVQIRQVQIKKCDAPHDWTAESIDFVNKLIQRQAFQRLGYYGIKDILNHSWLRDYPWIQVLEKTFDPSFKPGSVSNFDSKHVSAFHDGIYTEECPVVDMFESFDENNIHIDN